MSIIKIYRKIISMGDFNAPVKAKKTILYSNYPEIGEIALHKSMMMSAPVETVSKNTIEEGIGRTRCIGNKSALKLTQGYSPEFADAAVQVYISNLPLVLSRACRSEALLRDNLRSVPDSASNIQNILGRAGALVLKQPCEDSSWGVLCTPLCRALCAV